MAETDREDPATVRVRLGIAYDGTDFSGWARQPGLRTVQGVLEEALSTLYRRVDHPAPALSVAGRTDAGVHAAGQVAHLDLTEAQLARVSPESLARRLNGILGASSDVVVTSSTRAPDGFDARFAAVWRRYEYRIADLDAPRDPLQRHRTVWFSGALDAAAMDAAAGTLLGLHDFASFCKPRDGATTIRTLQEFDWHRDDDGVLVGRIRADAFCHSMVRALVGACAAVGEGKFDVSTLVDLRDALARTSAFKVMPAKGLTLLEVGYPDDGDLAARSVQTRAKRA
jgi:tRNA pseudouridine38-40 synthase